MRFFRGKNFWIDEKGEATRVPSFDELDRLTTLKEAVLAIDNYNIENKPKRFPNYQSLKMLNYGAKKWEQ